LRCLLLQLTTRIASDIDTDQFKIRLQLRTLPCPQPPTALARRELLRVALPDQSDRPNGISVQDHSCRLVLIQARLSRSGCGWGDSSFFRRLVYVWFVCQALLRLTASVPLVCAERASTIGAHQGQVDVHPERNELKANGEVLQHFNDMRIQDSHYNMAWVACNIATLLSLRHAEPCEITSMHEMKCRDLLGGSR
jgi:hypothetical protein